MGARESRHIEQIGNESHCSGGNPKATQYTSRTKASQKSFCEPNEAAMFILYIYIYICLFMFIFISLSIYVYMYISIYMFILYIYTCMCLFIFIFISLSIYVYMYISIYESICIYTYTHTHIDR